MKLLTEFWHILGYSYFELERSPDSVAVITGRIGLGIGTGEKGRGGMDGKGMARKRVMGKQGAVGNGQGELDLHIYPGIPVFPVTPLRAINHNLTACSC